MQIKNENILLIMAVLVIMYFFFIKKENFRSNYAATSHGKHYNKSKAKSECRNGWETRNNKCYKCEEGGKLDFSYDTPWCF